MEAININLPEVHDFTIPEGSDITVYVNNEEVAKVTTQTEMKIRRDTLIFINGNLVSTDGFNPVRKISDTKYKVFCWWQDSMIIKNGYLYKSISDSD